MQTLDAFMEMLCGAFDNREQCLREEASGGLIHPRASHVIGACNERMRDLPAGFPGCFVIEESYFDMGDRVIAKHYLFLYEEVERGKIRLTSYDLPSAVPRESLTNDDATLRIDYSGIRVSPRFTPLVLQEAGGEFLGENVSRFSPEALFTFRLRVTADALYVTELLERDGVRTAGFDTPIVYLKTARGPIVGIPIT